MDWNKEEKEKMLASAFPFWEKLTMEQQNRMLQGVIGNHYAKGTMLHYGGKECAGVQIIYSGQARVFVTSAGDYIVPAVGWRCQHLECSLHDAGDGY